jgi:hypothetical protein
VSCVCVTEQEEGRERLPGAGEKTGRRGERGVHDDPTRQRDVPGGVRAGRFRGTDQGSGRASPSLP